jgi:hypothetical protein
MNILDMRVNANSESLRVADLETTRTKAEPAGQENDTVALSDSAKLTRALKQLPEVRAEKVTRAKVLVQDPSYPSEAILRKVSGILADHINPEDNSG